MYKKGRTEPLDPQENKPRNEIRTQKKTGGRFAVILLPPRLPSHEEITK